MKTAQNIIELRMFVGGPQKYDGKLIKVPVGAHEYKIITPAGEYVYLRRNIGRFEYFSLWHVEETKKRKKSNLAFMAVILALMGLAVSFLCFFLLVHVWL